MKINISHIAKLANLSLLSKEASKLEQQLEDTIDYVDELNQIDTKGIEPTSQVTGLENITRDDVTKPSLSNDEALLNAKSKYNGFFKVNSILEKNE